MPFGETPVKLMPVGSIRPFWLPPTTQSIFHSSMRKSSDPSDEIVSTRNSAGCLAASIAARISSSGSIMPVAVSLCTTQTALIACARVVGQRRLHLRRYRRHAASRQRTSAHVEPMRPRHLRPFVGEVARLQHQDRIARRQQVGQRGLPGAVAGGVVHEQVMLVFAARASPPRRPHRRPRRNPDRGSRSTADRCARSTLSGMLVGPGLAKNWRPRGFVDGGAHALDLVLAGASMRETAGL